MAKSKPPHQLSDRSSIMRAVPRTNTKPEILVRKRLHAIGLRFRVNAKNLPGSPDIVLPKWRTIIFVHGCFWHRHPRCKYASTPKTRLDYWIPKFAANIERDARKTAELIALGWRVLVVWECETKNLAALEERLKQDISPVPSTASTRQYDAGC
ncbi:TPA: DNA mismatch endonuclease Vsr [Pseudomonas aeruginosa]|nr:DNA mismatch endonuclease Vsr [Pseudomonas aeruginosa]